MNAKVQCVSLALACCLFAASLLHGQTNETPAPSDTLEFEVDETVITGTRTYRKIIDVPYSIERIDNMQFKFDKKTSVDNVLGMIPGLFFQNRYGNHDVRISIRGFGSRSNTGIRGVRILLDGIPESEPDGQTRIEAIDFQSVGSIEVVKGNASSLYTNAPGGVINFINDIFFPRSFGVLFNEFGSGGLRNNGIKLGLRTEQNTFLLTYNYHQSRGYRTHSQDYWNIINSVLETRLSDRTNLRLYFYAVDGLIRLPGSLSRTQFEADPFGANPRDVARDAKRVTKKGRIGVQYNTYLGDEREHEFEVTGYGTIKYFERTAATYRLFNRNGIGASGRYVYRSSLFDRKNEFSVGGDMFYQTGPIEEYGNIGGTKDDDLQFLTDETISNAGFYFQNSFNIINDQLDVLMTGRYDNIVFDQKDQLLGVRSARRGFDAFTPKAALNFKFTPTIAVYTSYGLGFDTPAGNELENFPLSSNPTVLLNPDLKPQKSKNFELGIKGNVFRQGEEFARLIHFEAAFFNIKIEDEVVPFDVSGDVYFRNAGETDRTGFELGATVHLYKGLRFKTAYTFSDFTYDTYVARTFEYDTLGNAVPFDRSFAGNAVPSVPKHNLGLELAYEHSFCETVTGFVKGNYTNVSGMFADDANSDESDGYNIMNATIGCDVQFGQFNLLMNAGVNNIADKTYIAFININSDRREFFEVGEPRNAYLGVNLGYEF
ncbi:MAG: TonB-dependent receptor family protein [Bacteroidota bacterium]